MGLSKALIERLSGFEAAYRRPKEGKADPDNRAPIEAITQRMTEVALRGRIGRLERQVDRLAMGLVILALGVLILLLEYWLG